MSKKNVRRCLILLALLMIVFAIYNIVHIYAIFQSESNGTMQQNIANWTIKINNTLVTGSQVENFIIDNIMMQSSEHVKEGKIAPGLTGDFDILIDPTGTDVSVRYDVAINRENLTNDNIHIVFIAETEENNTLIETAQDVYTGVIPLSKIKEGVKNNVRISVVWEDDGTKNEEDTAIGTVKNPNIAIPVTITASQYLNEEIVAYE